MKPRCQGCGKATPRPNTDRCGRCTLRAPDLTGLVFGRWLVQSRAVNGRRGVWWNCECNCGRSRPVRVTELTNGTSRSCGCLARELSMKRNVVHGHAKTGTGKPSPTWLSWTGMLQRVTNPNTIGWANYGGRGITVCEQWRDFPNFLADMGERPVGTTLDRINNDGHYEPGNCRWATRAEQNANRRTPAVR